MTPDKTTLDLRQIARLARNLLPDYSRNAGRRAEDFRQAFAALRDEENGTAPRMDPIVRASLERRIQKFVGLI